MAKPRLGSPFRVRFASGLDATITARLTVGGAETRAPSLVAALASGSVVASIDLASAPLAQTHVVEAVLAAIGAIESPPVEVECRNCGETFSVDPARHLPLGPLLDPPGDPELDAPVGVDEPHSLPRPVPVRAIGAIRDGRIELRQATTFRLAERTLVDRARLEAILGEDDGGDPSDGGNGGEGDQETHELPPLPLGAPLIRAMGVAALDDVTSPMAIARALERLDDDAFAEAWGAIVDAWEARHYPPRLVAPVPCPACGARHDLDVPARPVLACSSEAGRAAPVADDAPAFPDLSAFRARAAEIAREVLQETGFDAPRAAGGLEIVIEEGVPPCDDGGEPLLGSYTPRDLGHLESLSPVPSPFTVALYYRSFRSMYEEEPYDVDAEIRETLAHELEHHAGHLVGSDPLDDEERSEIERERERLHGKVAPGEVLAGGVGWLAGDFGRFWRATWPIWIVVILGLALTFAYSR